MLVHRNPGVSDQNEDVPSTNFCSETTLASLDQSTICLQRLSRQFKNRVAVAELSFSIPKGTVFGSLGPNGAGKSTPIRLLLGLIPPTAGTAKVCGYDPVSEGDCVRKHCGALLEHSGLYERLSAEENLEFYGRINGMPAHQRRDRMQNVLRTFGLWERRRDLVSTWSRGMKLKLAIARAIFHGPDVVFLDEPTAGLDPVASTALREDIIRLARDFGTTIFLTSHNLSEVESLCSLIGVLREGRLIAFGSRSELMSHAPSSTFSITGSGFTQEAISQLAGNPRIASARLDGDQITISLKDGGDLSSALAVLSATGGTARRSPASASSTNGVVCIGRNSDHSATHS